jgi:hypothetical protein
MPNKDDTYTKQQRHKKYAYLYRYLMKCPPDTVSVMDNPSWTIIHGIKELISIRPYAMAILDRHGHVQCYDKETNTLLVRIPRSDYTMPRGETITYQSENSLLAEREVVKDSIISAAEESYQIVKRIQMANNTWLFRFYRWLHSKLTGEKLLPLKIVLMGYKEGGSVAEYVAARTGLEAVTFESCGTPPCKDIKDNADITRYVFSPSLSNTVFPSTIGKTHYLHKYDPTRLHPGSLSSYRPTLDELEQKHVEEHQERGFTDSLANIPKKLLQNLDLIARQSVGFPVRPYHVENEFPNIRESKFRDAVQSKKDTRSPNDSNVVSDSFKELLVRSTRSTIEAFIYALVFEQNPQLVTRWPTLEECLTTTHSGDINNLVKVEPSCAILGASNS